MPNSNSPNLQQINAELQRELAARTAERNEALAREAAITELLQIINSSPDDLTPVFEAMLDKALHLCESTFGGLWRFDGECFERIAQRGSQAVRDASAGRRRPTSPHTGMGRILAGENVVHLTNLGQDELYRSGDPHRRSLVDVAGARTALVVALRKDDKLLGLFAIHRREAKPYSEQQIALLQNFAAQAVIAMENARLLTETREALEQQTATAEVFGVINSSPGDLAPVFDAMLEKAMHLCEADEAALRTFDGELLHLAAMHSEPDIVARLWQLGPTRAFGLYEPFARGERVAHYPDVRELAVFRDDPVVRQRLEIHGIRTWLGVALQKDGVLLGVINVHRHAVKPFTDKQIALLQNFAAQAAIAMENARLITETREALEQQTATAEVLQVINASPGDLAPVFDAIVKKAMRVCGAAHGALRTFDGKALHLVAMHEEANIVARVRQTGPIQPHPGNPYEPLVRGERIIHTVDMRDTAAYREFAATRERIDALGMRTWLAVALSKDGMLLGALAVFRREVQPFSEREIALLENFAAQAVIAMENARLLGELRARTEEVAAWNRELEDRVAAQLGELERVGKLKRFLAPQLAEMIVSQGDEKILESHRREIVVVFCDLRGYTAFTETAEPEEVLDFLREYHGALGPLVSQFEGTLDQFSGDGIMVFFNDPLPCPNPAERAVKMAMAMREAAGTLIAEWRERGRDLGFGAGIAQGYATLGQIGFSERSGYTAIGTVCNVAARLCAEAKDGQILLSQRVNVALKGSVATEQLGLLALKGLTQPVVAYNVPLAAIQPALRVIEGGPQSV